MPLGTCTNNCSECADNSRCFLVCYYGGCVARIRYVSIIVNDDIKMNLEDVKCISKDKIQHGQDKFQCRDLVYTIRNPWVS